MDGNIVFVSAITVKELFSKQLDRTETDYLNAYIAGINVVHTNDHIIYMAAALRKGYTLRLPDAIIAATALHLEIPLATSDKAFQKIRDIVILDYTV